MVRVGRGHCLHYFASSGLFVYCSPGVAFSVVAGQMTAIDAWFLELSFAPE